MPKHQRIAGDEFELLPRLRELPRLHERAIHYRPRVLCDPLNGSFIVTKVAREECHFPPQDAINDASLFAPIERGGEIQ